MRPVMSVTTPVYNGEDFIDRCYFMLRQQTFVDWEWIVVNDGSTDRTEQRICEIDDPRVTLVTYKQNKGRGHARKEALRAASGDWLVVWDVDDVYFPDRLQKANQARIDGYDFCCSYVVVIDNELQMTGFRGYTLDDSGATRMFVHPSLSCRLALARQIGYNSALPAGEDAGLILHLARKCNGLWLNDAVTAYQQVNDVNLRKTISSNYARLVSYRMLYKDGILDVSLMRYARMLLKLHAKLALLNLFRPFPSLYLKTVPLRSRGSIDDGWLPSDEHMSFLEEIQNRHRKSDWSFQKLNNFKRRPENKAEYSERNVRI